MARTHGGGVACYRGYRPKTGSCIRCRIVNALRHREINRGPKARAVKTRYRHTALGMLADARRNAKGRLS